MDDLARSNFSPKLLKYMERVEHQTKRQIQLEYLDEFNLPGTSFGFRLDPCSICVGIIRGNSLDDLRAERSIAHEITHGLLIYGLGYYALTAKESASDEDIQHLSLLSFVDDVVVNNRLQEEGFSPFGDTYLNSLKQEIQASRDRIYIYDPSYSLMFRPRYIASRYVLAWVAIKYYTLDTSARRLINEFLMVFPQAFPREYEIANDIRKLILKNDIFSVSGHKRTIDAILREWDLANCCNLECHKT